MGLLDDAFSGFLSNGVMEDAIGLSDSMLTGTCSIYNFGGINGTASSPRMTNRGGVADFYGPPFTGVPCRMDVEVKGLIPDREKDNIETEKFLRYLYIPLSWVQDVGYLPEPNDKVVTAEGHPLGKLVSYKILSVNTETDEFDIIMLMEEMV